jgi:hypothetical protein
MLLVDVWEQRILFAQPALLAVLVPTSPGVVQDRPTPFAQPVMFVLRDVMQSFHAVQPTTLSASSALPAPMVIMPMADVLGQPTQFVKHLHVSIIVLLAHQILSRIVHNVKKDIISIARSISVLPA